MRRFFFYTLFLLVTLAACQQKGVFRPEVTPAPVTNEVILGEPFLVSFTELANNLERYQDTLIRVTGTYTPLAAPVCYTERGPRTRWSLVNEDKQMKVLRFEQVVVPLAWEGLTMTLDGVWRKYEGPLGCGKNAPQGVSWYLEALRIVEPNPIPDFFLNNTPPSEPVSTLTPEEIPSPDETPTAPGEGTSPPPGYPGGTKEGSATPTSTVTLPATPSATPSLPVTATPTPTPLATTPAAATPTETPSGTTTPSPTPETATPEGTPTETPGPGTPSVTPATPSGTTPATPTGYPAPTAY